MQYIYMHPGLHLHLRTTASTSFSYRPSTAFTFFTSHIHGTKEEVDHFQDLAHHSDIYVYNLSNSETSSKIKTQFNYAISLVSIL